ncbi:uncharacterized protein LOC6034530 [Culex quinquefasciatus]|uniref:uncharacterized protein LOC6034530 n=1 Tax=Culex quinquefasciatus TaxID=7176 RepID=UPI0018E31F01|nr:uncharacterized protein LOC6034530 [Culex quinquefasciatus]
MKTFLCVVLGLVFAVEGRDLLLQETRSVRFAPTCSLNINNQLPIPQPLILHTGTDQFRYPTSNNRLLQLNAGETVELACDNGFNLAPAKNTIIVSCVFDQTFNYDSTMYQFQEFSCTRNWYSSARDTNEACNQGATIIEIGFELGTRFPKIMDICHNSESFENHWVKHEFRRAHAGYQQGVARPSWYQGEFYPGVNVNTLYTIVRQRQTIAEILNSQTLADDIVGDTSNGVYMARGHIAARADFIYATHQNATFWFLNAAPQWQNFNDGNWLKIEDSTRNFVAARNIRVTVYGGTYGAHTQTDVNGDQQPIFLDFDRNGVQRLPAPKIYYKILHDEQNKAGIVLIGVNDVHITSMDQIRNEYMFCEDIGDKVSWINWDRFNLRRGFSYACEVNEFLRKIGHLPELDVPNLLI